MDLILPDGKKLKIDENITIEEKKIIVDELILEFEDSILEGWETPKIKGFLDQLSNLLCWHKDEEDKGTEDKYVNSKWKQEKADGKRKSKTIPFKYLGEADKNRLGIGGNDNE